MGLSPDSPEGFRVLQLLKVYGDELVAKVQALKPDPAKDIVLVVERTGRTPAASIDSLETIIEQLRANPPENDPTLADHLAAFDGNGKVILALFALRDDYLATVPLPLVGRRFDPSLLK